MTKRAPQLIACASVLTIVALCRLYPAAADPRVDTQPASSSCVACHQKHRDEAITLLSRSAHARAGVSCADCHNGDTRSEQKELAHKGENFIGKPAPSQILAMCGSCHAEQLDQFKTSRHFLERRDTPRLDCSQCHGAHGIGSPTRNFSFAYFCAGCHGLEYLPALRSEFQKLLAEIDGLNDRVRALDESGLSLSDDAARQRREIRRLTAGIVHPTDVSSGLRRIPEIVSRAESLKKYLEGK